VRFAKADDPHQPSDDGAVCPFARRALQKAGQVVGKLLKRKKSKRVVNEGNNI
jgi:hypothetical protein